MYDKEYIIAKGITNNGTPYIAKIKKWYKTRTIFKYTLFVYYDGKDYANIVRYDRKTKKQALNDLLLFN